MSYLLMFASELNDVARLGTMNYSIPPKENMWEWTLHRIGGWLKSEHGGEPPPEQWNQQQSLQSAGSRQSSPRRPSRKVVPSLPRPITFRRQNSERRDRLTPHEPCIEERRAFSVDRRASGSGRRTLSPPLTHVPSSSAPTLQDTHRAGFQNLDRGAKNEDIRWDRFGGNNGAENARPEIPLDEPLDQRPPVPDPGGLDILANISEGADDHILQEEAEARWILNLSMHFRDGSDREKFFVTYAEQPNRWRRVTVSCDYRGVPDDSLEADLKSLHYQRDKSFKIYESIHDSLRDIQFYPTVTNLKLQTSDGRLHVHVTEDVNEIILYPPVSVLRHISGPRFRESALQFESHLSGFVYQVKANDRTYIKKEIPGPDAVEEFLYEINALSSLQGAASVIQFEGIVVDDNNELIKGLLISFAEKGALVDIIYDLKITDLLLWNRRERWAKQIVQGLSEIHESGFVQGDFTLSNIVIDANDDAKIIDINRRGCPVGWEPPELKRMIESGQRISLYIGAKSDIFQLGMVLWALAMQEDEPERQDWPLSCTCMGSEVPQYYRDLVQACLEDDPRRRPPAKDMLLAFPMTDTDYSRTSTGDRHSLPAHRLDTRYIDPADAVDLRDIDMDRQRRAETHHSDFSMIDFDDTATSSEYPFPSSASGIVDRRGRSPEPYGSRQYRYQYQASPYATSPMTNPSFCESDLDRDVVPLPLNYELARNRALGTETSLDEQQHPHEIDDHSTPQCNSDSVLTAAPLPQPDSADLNASEITDHLLQDTQADEADAPSPSHHPNPTSPTQHPPNHAIDTASPASQKPPPPVPRQQMPSFGPPHHQDSGFDEEVVNALGSGITRGPG